MHDHLTPDDQQKQERYRDARFSKQYDGIWQTVGKCVFCDLNDKYVFFEENGIVLTITLYAYIDGHMMIIPRRHVTSAKELTSVEWQSVRKCMYIAKKLIKQVHNISGMQLVQKDGAAAQSTVEHIHFHAIPFDAPDLCEWNYRKLANTPLENVALYRKANKKIVSLAKKFDEKYSDGEQPDTFANDPYQLHWSELAFGNKKIINSLKATFVSTPRQISAKRFMQLIKEYLPKGNIVLGISDEPYVLGFEGQPQFKMLVAEDLQKLIDKVNAAASPHKIYTLHYSQRDAQYVIEKLRFQKILFVNGSWKHTFHTQPIYYKLMQNKTPYELISPFSSEQEAREYEQQTAPAIQEYLRQSEVKISEKTSGKTPLLSEAEAVLCATHIAAQSYDYSHQTGVVLAKKSGKNYRVLATGFNKVVPFQTYAMHYGASRETHFSPPNDLNHYDAIHAEVDLLIHAQKQGLDLRGATLFINLLPCPSCARMFCETDIEEFVYQLDHSDGYAVDLLQQAGKTVRRIVTTQGKN